ncbi:Holliday junction resolvase RuvX [Mycoplasma sp. ATU-Cv-508]|uniref:Holliday junction resolvase RuvX n=1 Tax=Mycoplasma sp. ATU-Cv-508 TaxID=2048001 RepID=UPI000FDDA158
MSRGFSFIKVLTERTRVRYNSDDMRKVGLDIGSKTCGVAVSDIFNLTAQGVANLIYPEKDWLNLVNQIEQVTSEYQFDTFVIGYPRFPSGDKPTNARRIDQILPLLKKRFKKVKFVLMDEHRTTKKAAQIMQQAGLSQQKQKMLKDQIAAQIILDDYLTSSL